MELPPRELPVYDIPPDVVQRWLELDDEAPLTFKVTRTDVDNLFFAIDGATRASQAVLAALISYSNGALEDANTANGIAVSQSAESMNRLRLFMTALMRSAVSAS